ncbi:hypothetical protein BDV97DRAFT_358175 [Delphinella strobiligena]|nr:hypothetical protein BDV97DRAFT_358175 [Delphinella strobiligena]
MKKKVRRTFAIVKLLNEKVGRDQLETWHRTRYHNTRNSHVSQARDTCCAVYAKSCDTQPSGAKSGRLQPRTLVLLVGDEWIPTADPPCDIDYVFISWHWASFSYDGARAEASIPTKVINMAKHATLDVGLEAYWLDAQCLADSSMPSTDPASNNIYSMSDVVRTARNVTIILPDNHLETKRAWAKRLWTLSEALLAREKLHVWICNELAFEKSIMSRLEIAREFLQGCPSNSHQRAVRSITAYYDGLLEMDRLERLVTAIVALSGQESTKYTEADVAYAFMGLIPERIEPSMTESLFQAMVKLLALTDDNDGIIERVLASHHQPGINVQDLFLKLNGPDCFGTYLRDIQPACKVMRLAEEDCTVFIAGCKLMSINWPTVTKTSDVGTLLAFDGIINLDELEAKLPESQRQRLWYETYRYPWDKKKHDSTNDTSHIHLRDPSAVMWTNARYHFFTLVDIAKSGVYHCQAHKRPTAALFCGKDGGLSRTVLCSRDSESKLLAKETVVRLPQDIWDGVPSADCFKIKML